MKMVFFVHDPMLFFFVTALVICLSNASVLELFKPELKPPLKESPENPSVNYNIVQGPRDLPTETTKPPPDTTKPPPDTTEPPPDTTKPPPDLKMKAGKQSPEEETANAKNLFGSDRAKNFRTGWKVGKKIYSALGKCEEFKNYFTCELPPHDNCTSDESSMPESTLYCVLEFTEEQNNTCDEECGEPPETPCSYMDGTLVESPECNSLMSESPPAPSSDPGPGPGSPPPDTDSPPADIHNYGNRIIVLDLCQCVATMVPYFIAICILL